MGERTVPPTLSPPMFNAYVEIDPFWREEHPIGWQGKRSSTKWDKKKGAIALDKHGLPDENDLAENDEVVYRLPFQFFDLEDGIEESASVNYADSEVIGRAESYKSYMGTGNREIPLVFKFQAQGLNMAEVLAEELSVILRREVLEPALWLDGLKYPYTGPDGLSHAPPPCWLQIGNLFAGRVIATDVQLRWQPPFDSQTLLAYAAEVSCTFTVVRRVIGEYYDFSRLHALGGF